jgi:hypothetical protein
MEGKGTIKTIIWKIINGKIHPEMKIPLYRFVDSYQCDSILKQLGNSPENSADFTSIKSNLAKAFGCFVIESANVLPCETDLLKSEKTNFIRPFNPLQIILSDFSTGTPASSKTARS